MNLTTYIVEPSEEGIKVTQILKLGNTDGEPKEHNSVILFKTPEELDQFKQNLFNQLKLEEAELKENLKENKTNLANLDTLMLD